MNRLLPILFLGLLLSACSPSSDSGKADGDIPTTSTATLDSPPPVDSPAVIPEPPQDTTPPREPYSTAYLLGQVNPAQDDRFVRIAQKYTSKSGIYMRKEAYAAFEEMYAAALADGVKLKIISATRTFGAQKGIWERKWTGATIVEGQNLSREVPDHAERATKILRFSSMPGTSRHHWGTDIDLNNLNNPWFDSGEGKKIYEWLSTHAHEYGFCQVYSPINEDRMHGYQEEKWHWSYLPLAQDLLADYKAHVEYGDITGFKGSDIAEQLSIIDHYVDGINPDCKE